MPENLKGFTLVELLVVISIIAILSAASVIAYSSFQQKGRDARRKSDLGVIQSSLEQYHADQGFYPSVVTLPSPLKDPGNSRTYLNTIPADPTSGTTTPYVYEKLPTACDNSSSGNCTKYCLYANLEGTASDPMPTGCSRAGYDYGVAQP